LVRCYTLGLRGKVALPLFLSFIFATGGFTKDTANSYLIQPKSSSLFTTAHPKKEVSHVPFIFKKEKNMNDQSKPKHNLLDKPFVLDTFCQHLPDGYTWNDFCGSILMKDPIGYAKFLTESARTNGFLVDLITPKDRERASYIAHRLQNMFCREWFYEILKHQDRDATSAVKEVFTPLAHGQAFVKKCCPPSSYVNIYLRNYNDAPGVQTQDDLLWAFEDQGVDMTTFMNEFLNRLLGNSKRTGEDYLKCALKAATSKIPGFMNAMQAKLKALLETTDLGDLTQNPQMKGKTIADLFGVDTRFAWIIPSLVLLYELRTETTFENSIFKSPQNVYAELNQAMDSVLIALPLSKAMFPFESPDTLLSLLNHLEILDEEIRNIFGNPEELAILDTDALFHLIDAPDADLAVKKRILELIVKRAAENKVDIHVFLNYALCERPKATRTPKKFTVPEYQAKEGEWKVVFKTVGINDDEVMARLEEEEVHPNQLPDLTGDEIALLLKGLKLGPRNRLIAQCRLLNGMH
jgi:hypothetical protein